MKRGFTNRFKVYYALVKVETLDNFEPGERITPEELHQRGFLKNLKQPVKIVGDGEVSKAVTVVAPQVHPFRAGKDRSGQGGSGEELTAR